MKADSIGQAFCNGFWDRLNFGWVGYWENSSALYSSWRRRAAWNLGWGLCHALTDKPLRDPPGMNHRARVSQFYCDKALTEQQTAYGEEVADRINVAHTGGQPEKS